MSGPVFMYRKGEARLFASPDEIPAGEGWVDSPSKVQDAHAEPVEPVEHLEHPVTPPPRRRGRPPKVKPNDDLS